VSHGSGMQPGMGLRRLLLRVLDLRRGEGRALVLSFICFLALMSTNYVLRPIRDALGVESGPENYALLFTGTFTATLILYPMLGALAARTTRTRFAVAVLATIAASLIGFRMLLVSDLPQVYIASGFFIWLSVFNVLLTSVFWSVMVDVFSNEQGRRLFGAIAAGGTVGAMVGPLATSGLVHVVGVGGMLLVAAGLLVLALACLLGMPRRTGAGTDAPPDPIIGGKVLAGLASVARSRYLRTISIYILFLVSTATFLYFQQGWFVERSFASREDRTQFFAHLDLATNILALVVQVLITRRLIKRLGVAFVLAILPVVTALGFAVLAIVPYLAAFAVFQVMRRASDFSLAKPAREILFTVVSREDKFKAKNVVDVVVYRGGDAVFAWISIGLTTAGLGLGALALAVVPLCAVGAVSAVALGRMEERRRTAPPEERPT